MIWTAHQHTVGISSSNTYDSWQNVLQNSQPHHGSMNY
jgi:hypothetical protein